MRQHTEATRRCLKATFSIILTTFLWLLPIASWAVMEGLSTEDLARGSDLIVLGDVESATAKWSDDGKTIFTTAKIVVTEVIKGHSIRQMVDVDYPGGEVGDIGLRVSDEPSIEKGEKVILFLKHGLKPSEIHKYYLVGKGQGKFSIGPDGVARKKGFSVAGDTKQMDAEVPLNTLIEKIKRVK